MLFLRPRPDAGPVSRPPQRHAPGGRGIGVLRLALAAFENQAGLRRVPGERGLRVGVAPFGRGGLQPGGHVGQGHAAGVGQ